MQERETLFLFLPATPGGATGWARAVEGRFVARGTDWAADGFEAGAAHQIALAPVGATGMALVDLPALAPAQAAAAARLALADRLALAQGPVVLAVAEGEGVRAACWVEAAWLDAARLAWAEAGLEPQALVPAGTLFSPVPGEALRARLGEDVLVFSQGAAWRDDPIMNAAMGGAAPVDVDAAGVETALLSEAAQPRCDLLVGTARKAGWARGVWGQVAALLFALAVVTALIPVGHATAEHRAAARLEGGAAQLARQAFPDAADPLAALGRGAQGGFARGYAALAQSVEAVPAAELSSLAYAPAGLQARVRVADAAARDALLRQLRSAGFDARVEGETREQGRLALTLRMEAP